MIPRFGSSAASRALAAATLAALAVLGAGRACARELAIERFDARIEVRENGAIEVTENLRFRFTGAWNGVIRDIPVEYQTPQGFAYRLGLVPLSVTGDDGRALEYKSRQVRHDRELKIWVPDAVDAVRTVTLTYRVTNALRFFENHDELYWNVTGDEWEMPIEEASAEIVLPDRATGLRALAFTGGTGSRSQDADVTVGGHAVRMRMTRPLAFREGLTAVVGWDKGVTRPPSLASKIGGFLAANWPLLFPVLVGFVMYGVWRRVGRDPAGLPVAVRYDPPDGLSPAEAGTLVDHKVDMRDVTATIVDLAVQGYLEIEESEAATFLGLGKSTEYTFKAKKPAAEWPALKPHERDVMNGLFALGVRDTVPLSRLKNDFYRQLGAIRMHLYDALKTRGFYLHRPDHIRGGFMIFGGVIAALSVHVSAFGSGVLGVPGATLFVATLLTGLVIVAFGWLMPARTLKGARAFEGVLGFEEFLGRVEADRLERVVLTPDMFERFLPYAMAFGVEAHWSRAFEGILTEPPRWYHSPFGGPFRATQFGNSIGHMSVSAASTLASAPRSSGGSGFGGGGSSGGGFGGGGGRGF